MREDVGLIVLDHLLLLHASRRALQCSSLNRSLSTASEDFFMANTSTFFNPHIPHPQPKVCILILNIAFNDASVSELQTGPSRDQFTGRLADTKSHFNKFFILRSRIENVKSSTRSLPAADDRGSCSMAL